MLLSFVVSNYLSFKDRIELKFMADSADATLGQHLHTTYINRVGKTKPQATSVLKSIAIYGPNASGKTNILYALKFFQRHILGRPLREDLDTNPLPYSFQLDARTRKEPSEFEVRLVLEGIQYRYGFSIFSEQIQEEWLFVAEKGRERLVFTRELETKTNKSSYSFGSKEGRLKILAEKEDFVGPKALLLTVAAQFNVKIAKNLVAFFKSFAALDTTNQLPWAPATLELLSTLARFADLGIADIISEDADVKKEFAALQERKNKLQKRLEKKNLSKEEKKQISRMLALVEDLDSIIIKPEYLKSKKRLQFLFTDNRGEPIPLTLESQSQGTLVFLELAARLIESAPNAVLLCDELEGSLHPSLCQAFFEIYHALPGSRQLIFTTHNYHLFTKDTFRRDQLWLVEKARDNSSSLTSLDAFTGLRKDADLLQSYWQGRFGAVPVLQPAEKKQFLQLAAKWEQERNEKEPFPLASPGKKEKEGRADD